MPLLLQRVGLLVASPNEVHCCGLHFNLQNDNFSFAGLEMLPSNCVFVDILEACSLSCRLNLL